MTDARKRLAAAIDEVWAEDFCPDGERCEQEVDAILTTLKLTPEAASALMDGTAVVVPVKPTDEQCLDIAEEMDRQWQALSVHVNYPSIRAQHRASVARTPYRINSDGN